MATEHGFQEKSFHKGAVLIDEGKIAEHIYLIKSGVVEIRTDIMSASPQVLAQRSVGQVIGEMSVFDNSPAMASAIAVEPVKVTAMSREEFHRRLSSMDPIIKAMFQMMIDRNREMGKLLAERTKDQWR